MKYLIVSSRWPAQGGGSEVIAARAAELLRDSGEEVVIVSSAKSSKPNSAASDWRGIRHLRYRPGNVGTIFDLPNFSLPRRALWHLLDAANLSSVKIFRRILEKEKPDIVLTHGLKGLGYLLPAAANKFGAKTIHTLHDIQLIEPSGIAEPEVRKTIVRWLWSNYTRALFGSPDAVIFPSRWLRDLSENWGFFPRSQKHVIRNTLSSAIYHQSSTAESHPLKTIFFLGQLEEHKGIRQFLEATGGIKEDYRLLVVGEGQLADLVKEESRRNPRVQYLCQRQGEALEGLWREADLLVVPSVCAENAPNVIQEAAAHGLPVIASAVGGIPELVREGETGWLVPPGDASALRAAITIRLGTVVSEPMRAAMSALAEKWSGETYLKELKAIAQKL